MPFFKMLQTFVLLLEGYALPSIATEFVSTPRGPFPRECVHEHPSGTMLEETAGGFRSVHPDGTVKVYPRKQVCLDHAKTLPSTMGPSGETLISTAFAFIKLSTQITDFSSRYTVAANPVEEENGFSLWVGLQDPGQANTVLQPVIRRTGQMQYWEISSMYCCPSGVNHYSAPISGAQPGDAVFGTVQWTSNDSYTITTTWNGQSSVLKAKTPSGSVYNWALALLEPHAVVSCDQLPKGQMVFSEIRLSTANGVVTPAWITQINNPCISDIFTTDTQVILKADGG